MNKFLKIFPLIILIFFSCESPKFRDSKIYELTNSNLKIALNSQNILFSYRNKDNESLFKELIDEELYFSDLKSQNDTLLGERFSVEKNNSYIELKDNTNSFAKIKYETDKITFELNTKSIYGLGERYGNLNLLDYYGTYKIINDHKYGDRAIMSIPVIYTDNGLCI